MSDLKFSGLEPQKMLSCLKSAPSNLSNSKIKKTKKQNRLNLKPKYPHFSKEKVFGGLI